MLASKYSSLTRLSAFFETGGVKNKKWRQVSCAKNVSSLTTSRPQKAVSAPQEYCINSGVEVDVGLKSDFTVEEVKIPTIGGYIAGKLWKGSQVAPNTSPILCMHGWLDNAGSFDTLLPLVVKPNMLALAIDFPGHGFSSYNSPPLHYDAHIESIIAIHSILQYYNWKKFTILGHSLGAIVGFVFAGVFPEIVEKFIALENVRPIPKDCKTELRYAISKLLDVHKKSSSGPATFPSYTFDEIVHRFYKGRNGSISLEGCKILMKRGAIPLNDPNGSYYRFAHDVRAAFPTGLWRFSPSQTEEIATSICCPVCFIKGEPGGDYEDRSKYDQIVQLMQLNNPNQVEYHHVEGSHHFHLNDPYPVAPIINSFLDS